MSDILTVQDIESFLSRVRATVVAASEAESLKAALLQLVGGEISPPAAPKARGRKLAAPPAAAAPKAPRPRSAGISGDAILGLLAAAPEGLAMRDFKNALGAGEEAIRNRLHSLRSEGLIDSTGQRRATRYYAVAAAAAPAVEAPRRGRRKKAAEAPAAPPAEAAPAGGDKAPGRKAAASKGKKGASRAAGGNGGAATGTGFEGQILALVRGSGNGGIQMGALTRALGANAKTIRKVIGALMQSGAITSLGNRRSVRYFAAGV